VQRIFQIRKSKRTKYRFYMKLFAYLYQHQMPLKSKFLCPNRFRSIVLDEGMLYTEWLSFSPTKLAQ